MKDIEVIRPSLMQFGLLQDMNVKPDFRKQLNKKKIILNLSNQTPKFIKNVILVQIEKKQASETR